MSLEAVLNFISKFRSFFSYLLGYFTGRKVEKLTSESKRIKQEADRRENLYEALRKVDLEHYNRIINYNRLRKERDSKDEYIINL